MVGLALVVGLATGLLTLADTLAPGDGSQSLSGRLAWTIHSGDHLHFAVHVAAGRVLDLCPCTRAAAAAQYYRAHFHAVTPLQRAVVATVAPRTAAEWSVYVFGPLGVGANWVGDGVAWLRGDRPPTEVIINLDEGRAEPNAVIVGRGATVLWRNIDLTGDAHALTAIDGAFASDWLGPGATFSYTFNERGEFAYASRVEHGEVGIAGVISVR